MMSAAAAAVARQPESDWCLCGCGQAVVQDPALGRGAARRFFADAYCVVRYRAAQRGERSALLDRIEREAAAKAAARAARPKPVPPPRWIPDADTLEHRERRWGPVRTVGETLRTQATSKRVRFVECGHEGTVKAREMQARCGKCRKARDEGRA